MVGAIAGDIIGSPYEAGTLKTTDFPLFSTWSCPTDDSVLTVATADVLLAGGSYSETYREYFRLYPNAGYGDTYKKWARHEEAGPYNSWGNGSAMRVSPVAYAFDDLEEVLQEARRSAEVTHNHPEGIKGAQATAAAVFMARNGASKDVIVRYVGGQFGYRLDIPLDQIRPAYRFDVSCRGTVPVAIRAFAESADWEESVRLAVSMGGDSDTLACITGSIAEAFYGGIPAAVQEKTMQLLDLMYPQFIDVIAEFENTYK